MNPTQRERLRQVIAAAVAKDARLQEELHHRQGPPQPGDLLRSPVPLKVPVFWAPIQYHPDDDRLLFVVPADDRDWAGTTDVVVPHHAACGPLRLRCGYGLWAPSDRLDVELRCGFLEIEYLRAARKKLGELVRGKIESTAFQRETEADPDYEDWLDYVAAVREKVVRWLEQAGIVLRQRDFRESRPGRSAAWPAASAAWLAAEESPVLAAAPGGLLGEIADVLAGAGGPGGSFCRVDVGLPGELYLRSDAQGISAVWLGGVEQPPRLRGLTVEGRWRAARWNRSEKSGTWEIATPFPWVPAEVVRGRGLAVPVGNLEALSELVVLRVGPGRGVSVTVQR